MFSLRPGRTAHCSMVFSLPQTLVKTLVKNLVKNLAKNLSVDLTARGEGYNKKYAPCISFFVFHRFNPIGIDREKPQNN